MNPVYDFHGQVALVTGAASGMGLATARGFAEAGASVALADLPGDALQAAAAELTAEGHSVLAIATDVSDEAQAAAMVACTVAAFGRLDMAYNNAGILGPMGDVTDETGEAFDQVNAINLRGVWACMKHELLQMRKQGSGAIVKLFFARRTGRACGPCSLSRQQARRDRSHQKRRDGLRRAWDKDQRRLPGLHRYADGGRDRRRGDEAVPEGAADRADGPSGGGRGVRALALQPRSQHGPGRRASGGWRIHGPLTAHLLFKSIFSFADAPQGWSTGVMSAAIVRRTLRMELI